MILSRPHPLSCTHPGNGTLLPGPDPKPDTLGDNAGPALVSPAYMGGDCGGALSTVAVQFRGLTLWPLPQPTLSPPLCRWVHSLVGTLPALIARKTRAGRCMALGKVTKAHDHRMSPVGHAVSLFPWGPGLEQACSDLGDPMRAAGPLVRGQAGDTSPEFSFMSPS